MNISDLPGLNAILNSTAAILLIVGFVLIKQGNREAHRKVMTAAFFVSIAFLTSYLIYHSQKGSVPFAKTGTIRTVYLLILLTHTILAAAVPMLAIVTLRHAWMGRFAQHRKYAKWTLPIWLYVSVTGVVVYWMLYRM